MGRYGNSCGIPFLKEPFCNQHREWAYLKPYLHDRPQQPWTLCIVSDENVSVRKKKTKKNKIKQAKSAKSMKNMSKSATSK
jgi:glucan-binding YG repeat protein